MSRPRPVSPDLSRLELFLREHAGFRPGALEGPEGGRRMRAAMEAAGFRDPGAYLCALRSDPGMLSRLLDEVTVGETYFFRHPDQWELVLTEFLPALRGRDAGPAQVWCAGCASGEEAYTLAFLADEMGLLDHLDILATDVSPGCIERARRGSYGRRSVDRAGRDLSRFLEESDEGFRVRPRYRERVRFRVHNLAAVRAPSEVSPFSSLALILCRNVMIYLEPVLSRRLGDLFHGLLEETGMLLTGPSDPPLWDSTPFRVFLTERGVYYRRESPAPQVRDVLEPRGESSPSIDETAPELPLRFLRSPAPPIAAPRSRPEDGSLTLARSALQRGDPGRVLQLVEPPGNTEELALLRIRALTTLGRSRDSREALEAALARFPGSLELRLLCASGFLEERSYSRARPLLRDLLEENPALMIARLLLASCMELEGDRTGARAVYRELADLCEEHAGSERIPFSGGENFAALGQLARARVERLTRDLGAAEGEP